VIDLSVADSALGEAPRWAIPPLSERVLHLHLWTPVDPQTSLCAALETLGPYRQLAWTRLEPESRARHLLAAVSEHAPTLLWMQLQTPGVVSPAVLEQVRVKAPGIRIVSWCGDVGRNPAWSHELAPACDAVFFSSTTQVDQHRAAGFPNAAYLQIGYDSGTHYADTDVERAGVVFAGQRFEMCGWSFLPEQEIELRTRTITALHGVLGDKFACYGQNWPSWSHPPMHPPVVAERYRRAIAAVSVSITSKLGRYTSDRLFRALACGPAVLVKRFAEMEALGLEDGVTCLVWDTPEECVDLAQYVLAHPEIAARIGAYGADLARDCHGWNRRMGEMYAYLDVTRD